MAKAAEKFAIVDAERRDQPMIVGVEGPPGGGKTFSALRLAKGIARVRPGPIVVVDTDNERAAAYADHFTFKHLILRAPFRSLRYLAAVRQANALKPAAIIIDSQSDEHEGEGGVLDFHREQLDRFAGDEDWKRDKNNQRAWIQPKAERLAMINGYLQLEGKTPLILCFRARQKTKPMRDDRGREVPTNIGWQPIAPAEITGNCNVLCLLPPNAEGVPKWKTGVGEEDFVLKLPIYAKKIFEKPGPLCEEHGEALARWARGEDVIPSQAKPPASAAKAAGTAAGVGSAGGQTPAAGEAKEPPASTDAADAATSKGQDVSSVDDDFPGDRGRFTFRITPAKGAVRETKDGAQWRATLSDMIAKANDRTAKEIWQRNRDHVSAARESTIPSAAAHGEAVFDAWTKRAAAMEPDLV